MRKRKCSHCWGWEKRHFNYSDGKKLNFKILFNPGLILFMLVCGWPKKNVINIVSMVSKVVEKSLKSQAQTTINIPSKLKLHLFVKIKIKKNI